MYLRAEHCTMQNLKLTLATFLFLLSAGMLYAQDHGVFQAYNDRAFERFWRRDLDPESVEAVGALLEQCGAPAGFASFYTGEGGARHDRLRAEAEASGIFGVPSFVFDGELFWGGDRVFLLRGFDSLAQMYEERERALRSDNPFGMGRAWASCVTTYSA